MNLKEYKESECCHQNACQVAFPFSPKLSLKFSLWKGHYLFFKIPVRAKIFPIVNWFPLVWSYARIRPIQTATSLLKVTAKNNRSDGLECWNAKWRGARTQLSAHYYSTVCNSTAYPWKKWKYIQTFSIAISCKQWNQNKLEPRKITNQYIYKWMSACMFPMHG